MQASLSAERRRVGAFTLAEIRYAPSLRLPRHEHGDAGFCLAFDGSYVESYGGASLNVSARTVTFSPSGAPHANTFSDLGAHCFTVDIAASWFAEHGDDPLRGAGPASFRDPAVVRTAQTLYGEFRRFDEASPLAVEGLTLELLAAAVRARRMRARSEPPWLALAEEYVRARFAGPIRLADVAREVRVHPVHLAATFREHRRTSVGELVRALRVEAAREKLTATAMPLAEIALACGFANQSHLSREFRRATSMSPGRYRRAFARTKNLRG